MLLTGEVCLHRFSEVLETAAGLLTASLDNRENRFHEAATICTLGTKRELSPNHSWTQCAFTRVAGRFDPFDVQKRP